MNKIDPNLPYAWIPEREPCRNAQGDLASAKVNTVFLTASRCPIGCSMCDLHRNTLPDRTPRGAIPDQIRFALQRLPTSDWIKLYNSGNFFDPASIPIADHEEVSQLCNGQSRVIIENHPRFGLSRLSSFRDLIEGTLEIAVGLESVQPRVLQRLRKQMTRDDFDRYATELKRREIDLRVFLIVGAPGIGVAESFRWARLSVRHAAFVGARHVSLIPARYGEGWGGDGDRLPKFRVSDLSDLFALALRDAGTECIVSIDTWEITKGGLSEQDQNRLACLEQAIENQSIDAL